MWLNLLLLHKLALTTVVLLGTTVHISSLQDSKPAAVTGGLSLVLKRLVRSTD